MDLARDAEEVADQLDELVKPAREPENAVLVDNARVIRWAGPAFVLFSLICILGLFVTFVGIFFRGPGYSFVIPYLEFFSIGTPGLHFAL